MAYDVMTDTYLKYGQIPPRLVSRGYRLEGRCMGLTLQASLEVSKPGVMHANKSKAVDTAAFKV